MMTDSFIIESIIAHLDIPNIYHTDIWKAWVRIRDKLDTIETSQETPEKCTKCEYWQKPNLTGFCIRGTKTNFCIHPATNPPTEN